MIISEKSEWTKLYNKTPLRKIQKCFYFLDDKRLQRIQKYFEIP